MAGVILQPDTNDGFLECCGRSFSGGDHSKLSLLVTTGELIRPKPNHNRWWTSLSTGSLPIEISKIRTSRLNRPGSCPLPFHSDHTEDIAVDNTGEMNNEMSHPYSHHSETCHLDNPVSGHIKTIPFLTKNYVEKKRKRSKRKNSHYKSPRRARKEKGKIKGGRGKIFSLVHRIDPGGKIVRRHGPIKLDLVKNIDWKTNRPPRAGVIVYTILEGSLLFGLGIDFTYDNITDFGGQVSYLDDKNAVVGGLREYDEETHGIFGKFSPKQVRDCLVATRNDMMVMFVPLEIYPDQASKQFLLAAENSPDREILEIIWLNKKKLFRLINNNQVKVTRSNGEKEMVKVYSLVGDFLSQLYETYQDFTIQMTSPAV